MNRRITHILLIFVYCLLGCTKYYKEPYHPKLPPIQSNAIEDDLLKAAREGNLEGVTECIKQGANIQEKDEYGRSAGARALEAAVAAGNRELVDQLLSLGVSLSEIDKNGDSAGVHALKAAAAAGNEELVELFISLFVVKYKYGRDDIYREALEAAAEANQAKVADLL